MTLNLFAKKAVIIKKGTVTQDILIMNNKVHVCVTLVQDT